MYFIDRALRALPFVATLSSLGCLSDGAGSKANLAIGVAPLTLPGVDEACYTITVKNGDSPPATVWSQSGLCSTQYGNGAGALSYIGTCDAQHPAHTVALTLTSLSAGGVPLVHPTDYINPTASGPIILPAVCRENADTPVVFNLTVMRSAVQGFFDIAVNFEDLFCSAKLDCAAGDLLFDPVSGKRIRTAVAGLACSGGAGADTYLYYSNLTLICNGQPIALSLAHEPGNIYSASSPAPSPFAQIASYQGTESLTNPDGTSLRKLYFNFAFALPDNATGDCSLSYTATASDGPLTDCTTPTDSVYPVIHVTAPSFVSGGAFTCGANALDVGAGVTTQYTDPGAPQGFAVEAHAQAGALAVTSCGFCGDGDLDPALEVCDPPAASLACAYGDILCIRCNGACQLVPGTPVGRCNDGTVQSSNEDCEPSLAVPACDTLGAFDGGTASCTAGCAWDTSGCTRCGDNLQAGTEACDGTDLTTTCAAEGFGGGSISCTASCTLDTSLCTACGNSIVETGEACDGTAVSCSTVGNFDAGTAACNVDCTLNTSTCTRCGDNVKAGTEACDGTDIATTCIAQGYDGGTVACTTACALDTAACTECGNAIVEAGETCDGGSVDCVTLGYASGTATCTSSCTYDTANCTGTVTPICGNGDLEGGEECDPPVLDQSCPDGVDSCLVCAAGCVLVDGTPGTPISTLKLTNGGPTGCVEQTGPTTEHCLVAKVSCDDDCQIYVDGVLRKDFDGQPWWTPKTVVLSGIDAGCHVLGVVTTDQHGIAAGFVGTLSVDGVAAGEEGFYVTAQTDAITVNPSAPVDAQGDTWSELDYDLAFPTATQCVNIDTWNRYPWKTWGTQYYSLTPDGAYPIWYNTLCRGDYTQAFARIVFTVPNNGTICDPAQGGLSTDGGVSWTPFEVPSVCGNGLVEGIEQCDPPTEPGTPCPANTTCPGCSSSCQDTTFTSCTGKPTSYNGNVTMNGDGTIVGIANPECITSITGIAGAGPGGNVTVNGPFPANPVIRFPNLVSIDGSGTGHLTINDWPDGVALFPALQYARIVSVGSGLSSKHIVLPLLESALGGTVLSLHEPDASGVTLTMPSLTKVGLFVGAAATGNTFHFGSQLTYSYIENSGTNTAITLPPAATSLSEIFVAAGNLDVDGPGLQNVKTLRLNPNTTLTGLDSVTTLGPGGITLAGNASMPSVTSIVATASTATYNATTVAMPSLVSFTAAYLYIRGAGEVTLPSGLATVSCNVNLWSADPITGLTASGLQSIGGLTIRNTIIANLILPALDTVSGPFEVMNNDNLLSSVAQAIVDQLSAPPPSVRICGNQNEAFCN